MIVRNSPLLCLKATINDVAYRVSKLLRRIWLFRMKLDFTHVSMSFTPFFKNSNLLTLSALLSLFIFSGCSTSQVVYVPTKCAVAELPSEPRFNEDDPYTNLVDLFKYFKLIKPIINECVEVK